jgi:hypothetical protein
VSVQAPALGDYRWHRRSWRRWSGRDWARAAYSAYPNRLDKARQWRTYPELPEDKRARLLERAVDIEVLGGATVVNRSDRGVTLAYLRPVSHVLHLVLTLLTGVWGFVWLAMILSRREDRVRLEVDSWGNIWPVRL